VGHKIGRFSCSFNSLLKVDFQGSRVTLGWWTSIWCASWTNGLGLSELVERDLSDSRRGKNIRLPLPDLLRQSIYSRLAGYEDGCDLESLGTLVLRYVNMYTYDTPTMAQKLGKA
jgi:hypothetical protein